MVWFDKVEAFSLVNVSLKAVTDAAMAKLGAIITDKIARIVTELKNLERILNLFFIYLCPDAFGIGTPTYRWS